MMTVLVKGFLNQTAKNSHLGFLKETLCTYLKKKNLLVPINRHYFLLLVLNDKGLASSEIYPILIWYQ